MPATTPAHRPFLRWAGGKTRLLKVLRPYFPVEFQTYYEPFVGGGAVFFDSGRRAASGAVLADLNPELINCWQCVRDEPDRLTVEYRLHFGGAVHTLSATGAKPCFRPEETCTTHFFKEHRWGYGITRRGRTTRYEVRHPIWETYPIETFRVDLDWAKVYGSEWAFLQNAAPCSTVLAVGSEIAVYPKGRYASAHLDNSKKLASSFGSSSKGP